MQIILHFRHIELRDPHFPKCQVIRGRFRLLAANGFVHKLRNEPGNFGDRGDAGPGNHAKGALR